MSWEAESADWGSSERLGAWGKEGEGAALAFACWRLGQVEAK